MLTQIEQSQLSLFKSMGTLSQAQAIEYHDLMNKEKIEEVAEEIKESVVEVKKKKRK